MGGAVGHLMHLHDDLDLCFKDVVDIFKIAINDRLENVTEKFDGLNLVFSWDLRDNSLRVARSSSDIKNGGLNADSLAKKFANRGNLSVTFNSAFATIDAAIRDVCVKTKLEIFGSCASRWYSIEIINSKDSNVIQYDNDAIIFHNWPTFELKPDGTTTLITGEKCVKNLLNEIEHFDSTSWKLMGPVDVKLKNNVDASIINDIIRRIYSEMTSTGLRPTNTLRDYVKVKLQRDVASLNLPADVTTMMVHRCMLEQGSPTLVDIKKNSDKLNHGTIIEFVKLSERRLKSYIHPIELIINEFAVALLEGKSSRLVNDSSKEVERLREETSRAVTFISSCKDEIAQEILRKQMEKLQSTRRINCAIEGVVFRYKDNMYKFTGNFAPIGQILGLFKYGRGGVKLKMAS